MARSYSFAALFIVSISASPLTVEGGLWEEVGPSSHDAAENGGADEDTLFVESLYPSCFLIPPRYLNSQSHESVNRVPPAHVEWSGSKLECVVDPFAPYFGFENRGSAAAANADRLAVHPESNFMINTLYPSLADAESRLLADPPRRATAVGSRSKSDLREFPFSRSSFRIPEPTSLTYLSIVGASFAAARYRSRRKRSRIQSA